MCDVNVQMCKVMATIVIIRGLVQPIPFLCYKSPSFAKLLLAFRAGFAVGRLLVVCKTARDKTSPRLCTCGFLWSFLLLIGNIIQQCIYFFFCGEQCIYYLPFKISYSVLSRYMEHILDLYLQKIESWESFHQKSWYVNFIFSVGGEMKQS
jgi:hypothetical protein